MNLRIRTCLLTGILLLVTFITNGLSQSNESAKSDSTDIYTNIIMNRINVVGSPAWKTKIPGAATYISTEQLNAQKYDDINRVLRSVTGVNIQEEDGFGLRPNIGIRGTGVERSSKINIMEDGVLIAPAPYAAPAAYYFPMVGRMSAVEVRKGSSQIKYGPNTTGGAINLVSTPIPFELDGNAELRLGEDNSNKLYANIGNSTENFSFLLEGMHLSDDGFKNLDGGGDTGYDITDLIAKVMFRTNTDASVYQRFELKFGYYDELSDETYLGLTRNDFDNNTFRRYAASQEDQMNAEQRSLMARHFAQFSEQFDVTTTLYRNDFSRNWYKLQSVNGQGPAGVVKNPNVNAASLAVLRGGNSADDALMVRANNREYYSMGVESIFALNLQNEQLTHGIELGIRLHNDEEDRFQWEDGFRMQDGAMILTSNGVPGTQSNRISSAKALSIFLQDEIEYGRFTFTPGVRLENIWFEREDFGKNDVRRTGSELKENDYSINEFIPGAGITYQLDEQFTLLAGVHKGFSPPSPGSDPDTRSEQSVNIEAGTRFDNEKLQAEVIGFFNDYSNLLGSDLAAGGGSGTNAQFNAGEVEVIGLELAASAELSNLLKTSFLLPFSVNYTYTDATFQNSFESDFSPWGTVEDGDQLPFIPEHQFSANLGLELNRISVNLSASSTSAMRTRAGTGFLDPNFKTDSYFLLDAGSSYKVTQNFILFVNVRNALDQTYVVSDRPHGLRPGLPRRVLGGVKFNL
ncbi:MAG: TonB-dependent receptor [Balneolaceae bacterium]|nr:TonB-dependent receptor [Balneolaceae bacterium]MDR9408339.1 TonB-dependent receptor [Balneolaceae bacterium]